MGEVHVTLGKRGRQAATRQGETIFKGHRSYDLMLNLQLGIRYSVGRITPTQLRNVLSEDDFRFKVSPPSSLRLRFRFLPL